MKFVHNVIDLSIIPTKLPRKQAFKREQIKDVLTTGFTLEKEEEDDYYGVVLDGDHLFLLGDFTVVHNTAAAIAEVCELVAAHPGCKGVVGGKNYPLLKRNVITEFAQRFSHFGSDWDHPIVKRKPTQNEMQMTTILNSKLQFLNLDKYLVARGFDADVVMIEEVNLMEAGSFDEMIRRSRGRSLPIRQFVLTMNPTGDRDWLYYKFNMRQYEPDYEGPPLPIGDPCNCHLCQDCLNFDKTEFEWIGGEKKFADYTDEKGILHKDRCYEWKGGTCPNCGKTKGTNCPGKQTFYRVIRSRSYDNAHNPDSYVQDMKSNMDADSYKLFVEGMIIQVRTGKVYKSFSSNNVLKEDIPINYSKPLIWTHDFNRDPMCSVLWQETEWGIHVVDEIIVWDANEEMVAREFCKRYGDFPGEILIYGDPAGLYGSGRTESRRTSYQILLDYLKLKKLNAKVLMENVKGETKIPIKDRINNTNIMLRNAEGEIRVKINPSCEHLVNSLSSVNWDEKGKEEDKNIDDMAKSDPNRNKAGNAPIMTHPSCAFGYAITKRWPIIKRKVAVQVLATEDGTFFSDDAGPMVTHRDPKTQEEKTELWMPFAVKKEEAKQEESIFVHKPIHDVLQSHGTFIQNEILAERLAYEKKQRELEQAYEDQVKGLS